VFNSIVFRHDVAGNRAFLLKGFVALALVVVNFMLTLFLKPSGMMAYVLPSVIWLIIFSMLWTDVSEERSLTSKLLTLMPIVVAVGVGIDLIEGIIVGYGMNIAVVYPSNIVVNLLKVIPFVLGVESFRYYAIKRLGRSVLWVSIIGFAFTFIYISPFMLQGLSGAASLTDFALRVFTPLLATNFLVTQVSAWGGVKPAVAYSLLTYIYVYMTPILPNTPWYLKPIFTIVGPLIQLAIISASIPNKPLRGFRVRRFHRARSKRSFLGLLLIGFALLGFISFGGRFMVVISGSMTPTVNFGDVAIVTPAKQVSVGDVIAFKGPSGPILHRVIGIDIEEGVKYITKGDANNVPDPFMTEPKNVIGKLWLRIPYLGLPLVYGAEALGGFLNLMTALVITTFFLYFTAISRKEV